LRYQTGESDSEKHRKRRQALPPSSVRRLTENGGKQQNTGGEIMGSGTMNSGGDPNEALYRDKSFLGHPKGLLTVCVKNLCSSFAYYGFTAGFVFF